MVMVNESGVEAMDHELWEKDCVFAFVVAIALNKVLCVFSTPRAHLTQGIAPLGREADILILLGLPSIKKIADWNRWATRKPKAFL